MFQTLVQEVSVTKSCAHDGLEKGHQTESQCILSSTSHTSSFNRSCCCHQLWIIFISAYIGINLTQKPPWNHMSVLMMMIVPTMRIDSATYWGR